MTGLRARQKADRQERILAAATTLFGRDGYGHARMEDVAQVAEVAVGTVYNYYGTKGDLLMATVAMEVEEVLAQGERVIDAPPGDAAEALLALTQTYYDHSLTWLSKEMWRAALGIAITEPDSPNGQRYVALDARLADQVGRLIAALQARRQVAAEVDARAMGEVAFHTLDALFVDFVRDAEMGIDALRDRASQVIGPLARLMEPRR